MLLEQFTLKKNIYAGIFFTEATTSVAPMKDTPLNVDHIYIIVEVILLIVDCGRRTKCYLTRVIQIELSRFGKVLINIHLNTVEWITWICLVLWCLTPLSSIFQLYRCGHFLLLMCRGWSWSYGSWICNCLCNQCLSSLMLWVRIPLMASCTRYNSMWQNVSVTCDRLVVFRGYSVSSINKADRCDIPEILFKVAITPQT